MKNFTPSLIFLIVCLLLQTTSLVAQSDGCGDFDFTLKANGVQCGSQRGEIEVAIQGGSGQYSVEWDSYTQSVWEKTNIFFPFYSITSIPPGDYIVKVMDTKSKCFIKKEINLPANATPEGLELKSNPVGCNGMGILEVKIPTKNPPFNIRLKGPKTASYVANTNDFRIYNLPAGDYEISFVVDECVATTTTTIENGGDSPQLSIEDVKGDCGISTGSILTNITGGEPGYTLKWEGPTNGKMDLDGSTEISGFESGSYEFTLEDEKGCVSFQSIVIDKSGMSMALAATQSKCNQNGTITVDITAGVAPYAITWRGGSEGSRTIDGTSTTLSLPKGTYVVEVTDANGCRTFGSTAITEIISDLYCSITPSNTTCNLFNGVIDIFISGGKQPYTISYTGPESGSATVNGSTTFSDLPPGTYTTTLQDADGCVVSESSTIEVGAIESTKASFEYIVIGLSVQFYNNSTAGEYTWSFGDETISNTMSPNKTYSNAGTYEVCLTTVGSCNSNTQCQTIQIAALKDVSGQNLQPTDISSAFGQSNEESFRVAQNYPNPFVNQTNILFELPATLLTTISIHNNTGKVVQRHTANYEKGSNFFTFNQNSLASGVYYYTIQAGTFIETKKMLVK